MSEIQGDKLIREIPVCSNVVANELVITKEEFLTCYNEWVLKPMRENPVSIQDKFYVPVENGGATPYLMDRKDLTPEQYFTGGSS